MSQRKDNDSELCVDAKDALEIYSNVDANKKAAFLKEFIDNGRGKGKNALKFRYKYRRTIARSKEDTIAHNGNDLNRLGCNN